MENRMTLTKPGGKGGGSRKVFLHKDVEVSEKAGIYVVRPKVWMPQGEPQKLETDDVEGSLLIFAVVWAVCATIGLVWALWR